MGKTFKEDKFGKYRKDKNFQKRQKKHDRNGHKPYEDFSTESENWKFNPYDGENTN